MNSGVYYVLFVLTQKEPKKSRLQIVFGSKQFRLPTRYNSPETSGSNSNAYSGHLWQSKLLTLFQKQFEVYISFVFLSKVIYNKNDALSTTSLLSCIIAAILRWNCRPAGVRGNRSVIAYLQII